MSKNIPVNIFWFRRDLRLNDNAGLFYALTSANPVICLFIFDFDILDLLDKSDRRVAFIHQQLEMINQQLKHFNSSLIIRHGRVSEIWKKLITEFKIESVFTNNDYEPYARRRDDEVKSFLKNNGTAFHSYKDQVIFEKDEIVKEDRTPYTVYTPYMKKWKHVLGNKKIKSFDTQKHFSNFFPLAFQSLPSLKKIGFEPMKINFIPALPDKNLLENYSDQRNIPSVKGTSRMSIHLRFGTISIRKLFNKAMPVSEVYANELIWREFYMMLVWHFPHIEKKSFKPSYEFLKWRNNEEEFKKWCDGETGYPIVDAGMRELNATGFMHNRLRMITAMFLTKYLLIDYKWGEAYFSSKLNDFDLANNNGGWQWCAGTGADAAPYFRIFNMDEQTKRFDPELRYIKKWVPELKEVSYPKPIVEYLFARKRCLDFFKNGIKPH